MNAAAFALRVDARQTAPGRWLARCPAHSDKSPSLSIREGRGGNVLVFDFAGCTTEDVLSALGLTIGALFAEPLERPKMNAPRPTGVEIRAAIDREAKAFRAERGIEGELWSSEINAIRKRVAVRLGVTLRPIKRFVWEGGPHDRDPSWPALFERAMEEISVRLGLEPLALVRQVEAGWALSPTLRVAVEDRAAAMLHELAGGAADARFAIAV